MENYIKEEKHGFFLDKTGSSGFRENQARMMVSLLAYNIVNFLHTLYLSGQEGRMLWVDTFRLRLLKVAGRVVRTARRVFLQLYSALFLFPPAYLNSWNFNTTFTGSNLSKA